MSYVVVASRRTDLPACYPEYIEESFRQGEAVVEARDGSDVDRICLDPDNVSKVVFWSRDYSKFFPMAMGELYRPYDLEFFCSVTEHGPLVPGIKTVSDVVKPIEHLMDWFGPDKVFLRFGPLAVWRDTKHTYDNTGSFTSVFDWFHSIGGKRVYLEMITWYGSVRCRFRRAGFLPVETNVDEDIRLVGPLVESAKSLGFDVRFCCRSDLANHFDCGAGCITGSTTAVNIGNRVRGCECIPVKDIGSYNQKCSIGCRFCYANPDDSDIDFLTQDLEYYDRKNRNR